MKFTFRRIRNHLPRVRTRCWSGVLPAHMRSGLTRSRRRGLSLVGAFSCGACSGPVGRGLAAGCKALLCRIWSAGAFLFLGAFFRCGAGQISCPSSPVERRRDKCWAGFAGVLRMVELFARYARPRGVDCPVSVAMTRVCWLNPAGHIGATTGKSIMRLPSHLWRFLCESNHSYKIFGKMLWHLWIGRAGHPWARLEQS